MTLALATLLIGLWLVSEAMGGSTDPTVLSRLGARRALYGFSEQSWRLLASMFLHYGLFHLVCNTGFLLVVGWWLEPIIGKLHTAYLFVYVGFAANLISSELAWQRPAVGASGAVLGLAAALLLLILRGMDSLEDDFRKRLMVVLAAGLVLSLVPDARFDNVAHGAGIALGGLYGLTLPRQGRERWLAISAVLLGLVLWFRPPPL